MRRTYRHVTERKAESSGSHPLISQGTSCLSVLAQSFTSSAVTAVKYRCLASQTTPMHGRDGISRVAGVVLELLEESYVRTTVVLPQFS